MRGRGNGPEWLPSVLLMLKFGWTEKQLAEEFSVLTLARIAKVLELQDKVEQMRQRQMDTRMETGGNKRQYYGT